MSTAPPSGEVLSDSGDMPCPVCANKASHRWYPAEIAGSEQVSFSYTFSPAHSKTFQVMRCDSCTHAFCAPIPSDIARHYQDVVDDEYLRHAHSRTISATWLLSALKRYHSPGRLLDVGCATGDFLLAARETGYSAEGIELSNWSSRIARERGLIIHQEYLDAFAPRHRGEYDFVTLWGVIEHFAHPRREIRNIATLLRPGGILALWTGDVDSVTSRLLGRRWWYWQGQHIQYFTHRSLARLVTEGGLEPVSTNLYPFAASMETISNSLRRYRSRDVLLTLLKPLFHIKPTWRLRIPGEMFFVARKLATPL
jgi:2-polyprenyl-3-methyl-5-hydroxy-6-metoxy-1,4-benzoquinol methylase